jgi:hypothetical protein
VGRPSGIQLRVYIAALADTHTLPDAQSDADAYAHGEPHAHTQLIDYWQQLPDELAELGACGLMREPYACAWPTCVAADYLSRRGLLRPLLDGAASSSSRLT